MMFPIDGLSIVRGGLRMHDPECGSRYDYAIIATFGSGSAVRARAEYELLVVDLHDREYEGCANAEQ
jgi:hypothetical protein